MIELKTPNEIATMREAGKVVAAVHSGMRAQATVGMTLKGLDGNAHDIIRSHGASSSFLGYLPHFASTPYPGVINASVNDTMLHGLPTKYRLRDGDLLSIDCGAHIDGLHADAAISFIVGVSNYGAGTSAVDGIEETVDTTGVVVRTEPNLLCDAPGGRKR
jgi:methionyl aminopeptidase